MLDIILVCAVVVAMMLFATEKLRVDLVLLIPIIWPLRQPSVGSRQGRH